MTEAPALRLDGLSVSYGHAAALRDASLVCPAGSVTLVTGPNGAGKSTLLLAVRGTVPSTGVVQLGGTDLRAMSARERHAAVAIVPQGRQLFPHLTVRENLQVMAELLGLGRGSVEPALDRFPVLRTRERSPAGVLSGGEQQMLALSRALMGEPRFVLLDEPMTGLAPIVVRSIVDIVRELAESGVGVVVVEPAVQHARRVADRGYLLLRGRIETHGEDMDELEGAYQAAMGIVRDTVVLGTGNDDEGVL
ncbi:ABC transporter ATP-binding protein [Pseudonocardia pini]|uniref:ABC transporter ATP-binding protein n=1 Tax=Pseudonocardia pini TaxID=2758030 RepID=UPI0015F11FE5|nr:ATP-binding cassette domain-containing protein [Pseudonocardia pini]